MLIRWCKSGLIFIFFCQNVNSFQSQHYTGIPGHRPATKFKVLVEVHFKGQDFFYCMFKTDFSGPTKFGVALLPKAPPPVAADLSGH